MSSIQGFRQLESALDKPFELGSKNYVVCCLLVNV